jgi:VWFA-related protein
VKPYDGAIDFLRRGLRPDDLAAVMVWNRVTALTEDRERLVAIVDRIRQLPTDVLVAALRDAQRLRDVSPETQAAIDTWFEPITAADGFLRSATALLLGTSRYRGTTEGGVIPWERRIAGRDLLKVYAGIEYLRNVRGQKHLVLISAEGLSPGWKFIDPADFHHSEEDDRRLAAHANDAGVALDIIHTIGTAAAQAGSLAAHLPTLASQKVAAESGGQFTSLRTAAEQLARIDAATRSGYAIGYVPANPNMDGRYRAIDIRVNRKDVTVVYRRGYTARPDPPAVDPRELMSRMRLRDAAASSIRFDDIRVTASAASAGSANARQVQIRVAIDPSTLGLAQANSRWTGSIDMMVLAADAKDKTLGMLEQRMDLDMTQARYDQARASGIPYAANVAVSAPARRVKVIVYNYDTDRLGTAIVEVK